MADILTVEACPACGSRRARRFHVGDTPMRRCLRCWLVHAAEVAAPDTIYRDES